VPAQVLVEEDLEGFSLGNATVEAAVDHGTNGSGADARTRNLPWVEPAPTGLSRPACRQLTESGSDATLARVVAKRVVVIDNYDSFTYNLVQYLETLGVACDVRLNDRTSAAEIADRSPDGVLISPGPGTPDDAGVTLEVIAALAGKHPLLGVCLGHQAIGQAYGGRVTQAPRLMHGKTSRIEHDSRGIFSGIPQSFEATRYHSLIIDETTLPDCLEISARTKEGEIMALRHRELPVEGVQFHPESILTEHGLGLLQNWVEAL
jgi:para-aminobenzoate synthetase component II